MYGFIGVGQAGANIADLAKVSGFPSIAINYSSKDLNACNHINEDDRLCLFGSEGVGKDRDLATSLMESNWETCINFVQQRLDKPSIEVIFVVFSTGGGSGSGISPVLIDLLNNELLDKAIVACPILPDENEFLVSQINTFNSLKDINELDCCILPIENRAIHGVGHKTNAYKSINQKFINQLKYLVETTSNKSTYTNLDSKDLKSLFMTTGFVTIGDIQLVNEEFSAQWLCEAIKNSWNNGIYSDIRYDKLQKVGLIVTGNEQLIESISLTDCLDSFLSKPLALFEGYYPHKTQKITTILTGLSFNQQRLHQINQLIESKQPLLDEVDSDIENIKIATSVVPTISKKKAKRKNYTEIFSQYKR